MGWKKPGAEGAGLFHNDTKKQCWHVLVWLGLWYYGRIMSFLDKFFGPSYTKELKTTAPILQAVNALADEVQALSDEAIREEVAALKAAHQEGGKSLDDVLPRMIALTREAATRTVGLRPYDVQVIGGILLHRGRIAEMRTGEGKTLVGTIPTALNALSGKGVHVVTVNDYLARRDAVWMGQVYNALGLSVGIINHQASFLYDPGHTEADQERMSMDRTKWCMTTCDRVRQEAYC